MSDQLVQTIDGHTCIVVREYFAPQEINAHTFLHK